MLITMRPEKKKKTKQKRKKKHEELKTNPNTACSAGHLLVD